MLRQDPSQLTASSMCLMSQMPPPSSMDSSCGRRRCESNSPWESLSKGIGRLIACCTLCLFAVFDGAGCNSGSVSSNKAAEQDQVAEVQSQSAAESTSKELTRLTDNGVTLVRGAGGEIVEVRAMQDAVTDEQALDISSISRLKKLTVKTSAMSMAGWQALSQLSELEQLDLRDCSLGNDEFQTIVRGLPKLRTVRLSGKSGDTTVDDDGLVALAGCPDLKALMLDHLWVGEQGIEHLSGNKKLTELYLAGTLVDDAAMATLAKLPTLAKLRLAQTSISAEGLQLITDLKLEELDISECSQVNDGALIPVGKFKGLTKLNLWRDAITDEGVSHLQGLTKLRWLNLDNTQLTDVGLTHLKDMSQLEFLHLGSTGVSDQGMPSLVELKSLADLIVTRTAVTESGVNLVTAGLPKVKVQLRYVEGE